MMSDSSFPILSFVVFLPLVGALVLLALRNVEVVRWVALGSTLAALVASLPLWSDFDRRSHAFQFVERYDWIPTFNIEYSVGIDGISLLLVLLTTFLSPIVVVCSWRAIDKRVKEFMAAVLLMETAMLGVFVALDFVLFYVFWEAMLIPMYLIIGVWGGPNRIYAAIKFFLYTLAGSLLLLVAMIALYFAGGHTFAIPALMGQPYSPEFQFWVFLAFFLAFAVKVPMFPFHTWLPDAHVEAPTAGSVILASVLLKMGGYGFIRFCLPMLPNASAAFTPLILVLSVVAIIYGAYMALAQADLKKLIAYSSVSHMGFVMLGLFVFTAQGIEGAVLQMINHGITTGALFLCVGMVYDRTHSRLISDYGGLAKTMPIYATMLVIFSLSSLGLPGTNSFVGEFLVLLGAFITYPVFAVLASLGIILAAVYMLWMVQRVAFGETNPKIATHPDLNLRELATVVPLVVAVFWIGVYPAPLLEILHVSVDHLLEQTQLAGGDLAGVGWSQLWGMVRAAFAS
jgi:NADH-quinone oxidoreductase subunit M